MTISLYYVLDDDGSPLPCDDVIVWGTWFETADRTIARDQIDAAIVSTVFLGLDHQFGNGPPLLYETMIFLAPDAPRSVFHDPDARWALGIVEQYCDRYSTRDEAIVGHQKAVALVRSAQHIR